MNDPGEAKDRQKERIALTRREILQGAGCAFATANAGWALAASAVPLPRARAAAAPVPAPAGDAISPVMERLSAYMAAAGDRELPAEAIEKAKHHILDTLAAMISGSQLKPGMAAIQFARNYGGEKIATVAGSNIVCGAIEAALANGLLAHSDETDDSHAPSESHPGCSIVPAALAAGEQFGIDGQRFLRAVTLGYDIGPRVTMTLGAVHYMHETHRATHAISGNFGSAAAAGCAAKLDARQMRWLMDYASQQCSGIAAWQRDTQHIEKGFVFGGMPARNGVTGALLVQSGWTGVDDIFSGPDNFFEAFNPHADPHGLVDKLGERFEVARTNIKKWTVGSPIQGPLDALDIILKQHPFTPDQVQKITVRIPTSEASVVDNRVIPDICVQHMIAIMLIDRTASFQAAHDVARMKDPAVLKQRAKVQLIPDAEYEKLIPLRVGSVDVQLTDGTNLMQRVDNVRGTAENPMTREEVVAKCRDLMTPVIGDTKSGKLIDRVLGLESVKNVRDLRPLLQRA